MSTTTHRTAPPPGIWSPVDPLGEALHLVRMSGVFYARSEFTAPWNVDIPRIDRCLMFHVVTRGEALIEVGGEPSHALRPGEFLLVTQGTGHRIRSREDTRVVDLFDIEREFMGDRYELIHHGGGGEATSMICGAVRFDHPAARRLVSLLPSVLRMEAWSSQEFEWTRNALGLMATETQQVRPGGEAVIARLADILVIQAIRSWISSSPNARAGWLGALQDPQIGRALGSVHKDPAKAWTVASMAQEVGMSRSAFSARFKELVGDSPMGYVTQWRMQVAEGILEEESCTMGEVADRVGYSSEAAFSRAFKAQRGVPPVEFRRMAAAREH